MVCFLQRTVESQGKKVADLEDYIDGMVLRVMEKAPVILDTNLKYYCSLYKQRWLYMFTHSNTDLILVLSLDIEHINHNSINIYHYHA